MEIFIALLALLLFAYFLAVGMTIPFAIGIPALLYIFLLGGLPAFRAIGIVTWGSMNSFILVAAPLFIFMAEIMQGSGMNTRIYSGLAKLVSRIPGGLLQTGMVGCAVFASMSGSSVITAVSVTRTALPEMMSRNYDRKLAAGSLAAGGTLGILIPPSIPMIIYGSMTDVSVAKLFMAGVVPGLLLVVLFMIYIAGYAFAYPGSVPSERSVGLRGMARGLVEVVPFALLVFAVLGSIYAGWATPTEAAALGCVAMIAIAAFYGQLALDMLLQALKRTVISSGAVLFIVYSAFLFAYAVSLGGVGELVTDLVIAMDLSYVELLITLLILYLVLGTYLDSLGMIVITVPLLLPVLNTFDVNLIWFGVALVVLCEIAQISPPMGLNLFIIQGMWEGKMSDIWKGVIPFIAIMILLLVMMAFFPEIVLWLPERLSS